jgi:hypothetical protein
MGCSFIPTAGMVRCEIFSRGDAGTVFFRQTAHEMRRGTGGHACAQSFLKTLKGELETLDTNHSAVEVRADSVYVC